MDVAGAGARLEAALAATDPASALESLARDLKSAGMGQVALYRLFSGHLVLFDGADPLVDAVAEMLDLIWGGPWAKGRAIFDRELSEPEVADPVEIPRE